MPLTASTKTLGLMAVALAIMLTVAVPVASANSVSITTTLSSNNLGISGSVGTVTMTQTTPGQVTVNVTMNPGYTIKLQGGDFALNSGVALSSTNIGPVTILAGLNTFSGLDFKGFKTTQNVSQFGVFGYDLANLSGGPKGTTSASQMTFIITAQGLTLKQLAGNVAIHFCVAGGTKCGNNTGFASGTLPPPVTVPEPGTLGLMGTGLIGLAGVARRRFGR
ncbi:MAG: hypothetical protein DMG68_01875 [Acidobacteria bacterium]|jgi:hypothetical protein|nr:MAG: hypothetical protein DMG68_01875 [Acidobacteriota bacterium]